MNKFQYSKNQQAQKRKGKKKNQTKKIGFKLCMNSEHTTHYSLQKYETVQ
jgi:hypothetical protein